jgi:hypothetical protein
LGDSLLWVVFFIVDVAQIFDYILFVHSERNVIKNVWAILWVIFSHAHLVTLLGSFQSTGKTGGKFEFEHVQVLKKGGKV